ncbi:DUF4199 domain-containing protein [Sphingomonas sp. R-74633]|uniref:DUF4199 domain-containing protein n=1 Tax=Sphingomonas sp. R-74633 TaxID=2751188 RepID=UPI0015D270FB|nr:DUF4199 domain-containing protein [Sphingomonas sp. R-74633]NYT40892.1 DUF4199 domain-containing protein [Sphingomonas sp. R-74633]
MLRNILIFGAIGGLIAGGAISVAVLLLKQHSMAFGYLSMLVGLSTIFVAIKRQRDVAQGGVIGFMTALGMGVAMSVVAGIFYALAWEVVLQMIGGPGAFIDGFANAMLKGLSGDALAKMTAEVESMRASYRNPLFRLPMTFMEIFPVGLFVALVSAGLLCNRRFLPARAAA